MTLNALVVLFSSLFLLLFIIPQVFLILCNFFSLPTKVVHLRTNTHYPALKRTIVQCTVLRFTLER